MFTSRNLRRFAPIAVVALGLAGCEDKAGVKQETTYTSPEGQTTVTKETKVETTGDHAPSSTTGTTGTAPGAGASGTTGTPSTSGNPGTPGSPDTSKNP